VDWNGFILLYNRLEQLELLKGLEQTDPDMNGAQRLNDWDGLNAAQRWNDWNWHSWNRAYSAVFFSQLNSSRWSGAGDRS
jgi:hypothetical protein